MGAQKFLLLQGGVDSGEERDGRRGGGARTFLTTPAEYHNLFSKTNTTPRLKPYPSSPGGEIFDRAQNITGVQNIDGSTKISPPLRRSTRGTRGRWWRTILLLLPSVLQTPEYHFLSHQGTQIPTGFHI